MPPRSLDPKLIELKGEREESSTDVRHTFMENIGNNLKKIALRKTGRNLEDATISKTRSVDRNVVSLMKTSEFDNLYNERCIESIFIKIHRTFA